MDCDKAVVKVEPPTNLVLFIVNILLPGIGTIISAFMDKGGMNNTALIYGVLQLLTAWILIGWCWSIYHGYLIYLKGSK